MLRFGCELLFVFVALLIFCSSGCKDAAQAANMMITVKRRFAKALYEEVGRTVGSPAEVEDELNALLRTLERTG